MIGKESLCSQQAKARRLASAGARRGAASKQTGPLKTARERSRVVVRRLRSASRLWLEAMVAFALAAGQARAADAPPPAWAKAHLKKPMDAEETKGFMKRLAQFVEGNHLKKSPLSPQRGMVYEYFAVARKGHFDQFVQGEGLDTMHDGAWLAAAMANGSRATGDPFYRKFLSEWQMPFYCKMLNHSDTLFTTKGAVARPGAMSWGRSWALQEGEKGFVPYWWDDGGSVSLERSRDKNPLPNRPSIDHTVGKPNPKALLNGYSLGMSNHMAQDLGVMVQLAWLLFRDSEDEAGRKLAAEIAQAARNLHECRMRHHGPIPMCVAPAALANADAGLMQRVPDPSDPRLWTRANHYTRALYAFKTGQRMPFPGFADDQQYRYYYGIARAGGTPPRPLAFRTIVDAYTEPMLYRYYCDDAPVPPGINRFDLYTYYTIDGKPTDYRSDRKGPHGSPKPIGSRMGPQNMVCCGWALQMLKAFPGIWEEPYKRQFAKDLRVYIDDPPPAARAWETPIARLSLDDVTLDLVSKRAALHLHGESKADRQVVRIFARPDGAGTHAVLTVARDRSHSVVNDKGEALRADVEIKPVKEKGFSFSVVLPYTVAKGQKPWANGIEHGRYSIQVGHEQRNLYLASGEAQVKAWLERELAGGLRTWQAIFDAKGFIPTGMGTHAHWDGYSDSGGYAHLISAAAQWLLCLDGKTDWDIHDIPAVLKSK